MLEKLSVTQSEMQETKETKEGGYSEVDNAQIKSLDIITLD